MNEQPSDAIAAGLQARSEDRLDEALAAFRRAVELSRASLDPSLLAQALTGLGRIERDLKDYESSLRRYTEAARIYRQLGEPQRFAHAIRHIADIQRNENHLPDAKLNYAEALDIYRKHPDTKCLDLANAIRGLALTERELGDLATSRSLWQEARTLYESAGVQAGVEESDVHLRHLESK